MSDIERKLELEWQRLNDEEQQLEGKLLTAELPADSSSF